MKKSWIMAVFCLVAVGALSLIAEVLIAQHADPVTPSEDLHTQTEETQMAEEQPKECLTPEQYHVMREEGTERAFTSPLYHETRQGIYVCAACGQPLFKSHAKYDSGTGWPSFFEPIPGSIDTKIDLKLGYPRKEYHCSRCKGHLGHVFDDGPGPKGERYCNNGVALRFVPDAPGEGDESGGDAKAKR